MRYYIYCKIYKKITIFRHKKRRGRHKTAIFAHFFRLTVNGFIYTLTQKYSLLLFCTQHAKTPFFNPKNTTKIEPFLHTPKTLTIHYQKPPQISQKYHPRQTPTIPYIKHNFLPPLPHPNNISPKIPNITPITIKRQQSFTKYPINPQHAHFPTLHHIPRQEQLASPVPTNPY